MAHTYATIEEFKKFMVDTASDFGTASDTDLLATLESVSRTIDGHVKRTGPAHPASGFGPRTGTNRYGGSWGELDLDDDLLSITSVTVGGTTKTDETDFLKGPWDRSPYRVLIPKTVGGTPFATETIRGISVAGSWGHQDVRVTSSATTAEALDTSETAADVSSGTPFSPGHTLLVDSEQLYVTAVSTNTLTVVRASNGTTAASHLTSAAIDVYQYPANVKQCALVLAQRRRKARDAGLSGNFGGVAGMPTTMNMDRTERWILDDFLGDLKFAMVA